MRGKNAVAGMLPRICSSGEHGLAHARAAEDQVGQGHGEDDGQPHAHGDARKLRARLHGISRAGGEGLLDRRTAPRCQPASRSRRRRRRRPRTATARCRNGRAGRGAGAHVPDRPAGRPAAPRRARTSARGGCAARTRADARDARPVPRLVHVEPLGPGLEGAPDQQVHAQRRDEQGEEGEHHLVVAPLVDGLGQVAAQPGQRVAGLAGGDDLARHQEVPPVRPGEDRVVQQVRRHRGEDEAPPAQRPLHAELRRGQGQLLGQRDEASRRR